MTPRSTRGAVDDVDTWRRPGEGDDVLRAGKPDDDPLDIPPEDAGYFIDSESIRPPEPERLGLPSRAKAQALIDDVVGYELKNVRLTHDPEYDPYLKLRGRMGEAGRDTDTLVGPGAIRKGRAETLDTIVHEEMHHRIWGSDARQKWLQRRGISQEEWAGRVAERFTRMKLGVGEPWSGGPKLLPPGKPLSLADQPDRLLSSGKPVAPAGRTESILGPVGPHQFEMLPYEFYYHATSSVWEPNIRSGIDLTKQRLLGDFGRNAAGLGGFCLTKDHYQAVDWANRAPGKWGGEPAIVKFVVPQGELQQLRGKVFEGATPEWEQFVIAGRRGELQHTFYYVEGPLLLNPEEATAGIEPPIAGGHQIVIFTDRAVEVFQRYIQRR